MRELVVILETIAFFGLAPGFVASVAVLPLRRPLDRMTRSIQQLPPDQFRNAIMLPMVSVGAGAMAGIGSNLFMADQQSLVGFVLLFGALFFVLLGGQLATRPTRRVAAAAVAYRRELLAGLARRDWSNASREERARAGRQLRRLAATGSRLITYAESRTFRQWLRRRNRVLLAWFSLATAYTTGVLIYVLSRRIAEHDWTIRPGTLLVVSLPVMGPAQLWLWYRDNRETLRDFGVELHKEASAVLAVIAAIPPWTLRRRMGQAVRLLFDLDRESEDQPG